MAIPFINNLSDAGSYKTHRTPCSVKELFLILNCILHDYLRQEALFVGKNFEMMFQLSRSKVQRLLEDIGN
jgi:hypothetical protein